MPSLTGHEGDQLPACQMILDVTGDFFTHGRQLKQLVFNDRIIGLLGKLPILVRYPTRYHKNTASSATGMPMSEVQMKNQTKPVCSITKPENPARINTR